MGTVSFTVGTSGTLRGSALFVGHSLDAPSSVPCFRVLVPSRTLSVSRSKSKKIFQRAKAPPMEVL
ncbi:MAG: hypothetical protein IIB40_00200 [Candidatus Marinimicrobia bacterium]|nr:hypothetical protein [Candidatus Neomarinimicrobiota bacterium]MCH7954758.1 hypothetical protein [Candidatus Neomarinimicrobiota bacterium]